MRNNFIKNITLSCLFFLTFTAHANDYQNESLKEVLSNAVYRDGPSIKANKLGIIPGGFVIAVTQSKESTDWLKIHQSEHSIWKGYVHSSLLADTSTSYIRTEINNEVHLIKNFQPRNDLGAINPHAHARIYTQDGKFLSHFPRLEDLKGIKQAVYVRPQNLDSKLPYYSLSYSNGGAHGHRYSKFVSKEPFAKNDFIVNSLSRINYDEVNNEYTFIVKDTTYTYWYYSYASSPIPKVKLKLVNGVLVVSEDMIKDTHLTEDEFKNLVYSQPILHPELDVHERDKALSQLTRTMLEFIYAGQPEKAREFIDTVWPEDKHSLVKLNHKKFLDRESFKNELNALIKSSPYQQAWMFE